MTPMKRTLITLTGAGWLLIAAGAPAQQPTTATPSTNTSSSAQQALYERCVGFGRKVEIAPWKQQAVSPVTNPIFFEDPHVRTEVRPIYMYHVIDDDFLVGGGDVNVGAVQARWALTERLAIIATKDGYVDIDFDDAPALSDSGWVDVSAGVKYAIIDSDKHQFILTPGVKYEIPVGNTGVFQGNGDGEFDIFVSTAKSWNCLGLENLRTLGSVGLRLPIDMDEETAQAHYSLQMDYRLCRYFIPFAAINAFTVLSEGDGLPLGAEGFDLINFGASDAEGKTQPAAGVGFRSQVLEHVEAGFAYEHAVGSPRGLYEERFTLDAILHF